MTLQRAITDAIYTCLFDGDAATLRARLGLPEADTEDDDRLRDEMGESALHFLAAVEEDVALWLRQHPNAESVGISAAASRIANLYREQLVDVCRFQNVDVLTGKTLQ